MIAPLSTGASHTVLGLAGAAVGMLVVWVAGCALAPARPPAERLAWGVVAMLAVAWSTLWQPVLGVSWLGHRTLMAVIVVVGTVVVAARTRAWRTAPDVRKPVVLVAALALAVSVLPLVWGPSAVVPISDMQGRPLEASPSRTVRRPVSAPQHEEPGSHTLERQFTAPASSLHRPPPPAPNYQPVRASR